MTPWVPLFPYPICCLCYERRHDGHHGWDVCCCCVDDSGFLDDVSCECYFMMADCDADFDTNRLGALMREYERTHPSYDVPFEPEEIVTAAWQ